MNLKDELQNLVNRSKFTILEWAVIIGIAVWLTRKAINYIIVL